MMETKDHRVGPARCRIRQATGLPERMRARTRELCCLEVPAGEQGKGYATTLVHKVCREADAANIVLVLWPQPFGENVALSRDQLEAWYSRAFGFQRIQHDPVLMARMPGATPRMLTLNPVVEAIVKERAA